MEPEGSLPHSQEHATCPYPTTTHNNNIFIWYIMFKI
jgi:hypothetical protein